MRDPFHRILSHKNAHNITVEDIERALTAGKLNKTDKLAKASHDVQSDRHQVMDKSRALD
jgi:hypothetical protein